MPVAGIRLLEGELAEALSVLVGAGGGVSRAGLVVIPVPEASARAGGTDGEGEGE